MLDSTPQTGQIRPANRGGNPPEHARFKAGQSGNPRGRPKKDLDLAALAQKHAEKAVETLALCLVDAEATWPAKVSAAAELLDRGFGRAPASLDVTHKHSLSDEFEALLQEIHASRKAKEIVVEQVCAIESPETTG